MVLRTGWWKHTFFRSFQLRRTLTIHNVKGSSAEKKEDTCRSLSVNDKLAQLKLSLHEELETLKQLDLEVVDLTPEGLDEEIEQADDYKDNIYHALTMIDKALKPKPSPPTPAASALMPTSPAISPHINFVLSCQYTFE